MTLEMIILPVNHELPSTFDWAITIERRMIPRWPTWQEIETHGSRLLLLTELDTLWQITRYGSSNSYFLVRLERRHGSWSASKERSHYRYGSLEETHEAVPGIAMRRALS